MKIETIYDGGSAGSKRHRAFVSASELTAGQDEGTYTINDAAAAASLGPNSAIVVTDMPGTMLFWDSEHLIARVWSSGGGGDLEEKSVTITENGTSVIEPSEGKDGLSKVTVIVSVSDTIVRAHFACVFDFTQYLEEVSWDCTAQEES